MATIADDDGDQPAIGAPVAGVPPSAPVRHTRPSGLDVVAEALDELDASDEAGVTPAAALLCEDLDELDLLDAFVAHGPVTIVGSDRAAPLAAVVHEVGSNRWRWRLAFGGSPAITLDAGDRAVVRVLGAVAAAATPGPGIAAWERLHRPASLRWFPPGALLDDGSSGREVTAAALSPGRSLLFLHDAFGRTITSFHRFDPALHDRLDDRYGHRLWAYDHPTVSATPEENAAGLVALLFPDGTADALLDIDVVAHGRGAAVAAALATLDPGRIRVGTVVAVGAPVDGTPIAAPSELPALLDAYTVSLASRAENPLTTTVDALAAAAVELARSGPAGVPGLTALASPIALPAGARVLAGSAGADDALLGPRHDGVVPVPAAAHGADGAVVTAAHRDLWSPGTEIIDRWLVPVDPARGTADQSSTDAASAVTGSPAPARAARRLTKRTAAATTTAHPLRLSVLHASVEHADHPLVIGHFRGAELTQTEELLDARLGGRLGRRHLARRYPELVGDVLVLPNAVADGGTDYPPAVLIVGLGAPGMLTRSLLTEAVAAGLLDHALAVAEAPPHGPDVQFVHVSARLLGTTGRSALPVDVVVGAITDAALAVNAQLVELADDSGGRLGQRVRIGHVQFVERYADKAELATRAVTAIDDLVLLDAEPHTTLVPDASVTSGAGAWPPRSLADEPAGWQRVLVRTDIVDERSRLSFTVIGSRAQVEQLSISVDTRTVRSLLDRARTDSGDGRVAAALFDLLVPRLLRADIATADNLQFIVDGGSAAFPWEALVGSRTGAGGGRPLSRRGGFIRQFHDTEGHRGEIRGASARRALVIGNPPGDPAVYPSLPYAYDEAVAVADQLGAASVDVLRLVWPAPAVGGTGSEASDGSGDAPVTGAVPGLADDGADVVQALTDDVRILHIAGHGAMRSADDPVAPLAGGAVIGRGVFLTADDVTERTSVPELVFLNCCSLGAQLEQAANLARAFMTRGAQAVVAAGWPVNDVAAKAFADRFYLDMLAGETFGTAVQRARRQAYAARPHSLTWAAYQCYGDPGYRLEARRRGAAGIGAAVSEDEFLRQIRMIGTSVGDVGRPDADRLARARLQLVGTLDEMAHRSTQRWKGAVVAYELASAYGELGEFDRAIAQYERALASTRAQAPVKALEQVGNLKVRRAQQLARANQGAVTSAATALADQALQHLQAALAIGATTERLALLASYHKKRATFDVEDRPAHLTSAVERYWQAYELDPTKPYPLLNFLQLHTLLRGMLPLDRVPDPEERLRAIELEIDATTDDREGFWGLVARADAGLTRLIASGLVDAPVGPDGVAAPGPVSVARWYQSAFALRSSWRERRSCIDHLEDLIALCGPPREALEVALRAVHTELLDFTRRTFGTNE